MEFAEIERLYALGIEKKEEMFTTEHQLQIINKAIESLMKGDHKLEIMLGFGNKENIATTAELYSGLIAGLKETKKLYIKKMKKMDKDFEALIKN